MAWLSLDWGLELDPDFKIRGKGVQGNVVMVGMVMVVMVVVVVIYGESSKCFWFWRQVGVSV